MNIPTSEWLPHGLMTAEGYIRASDVKPVTGYREPVGRAIPIR
ncbi:MAG: hypothetical protein ACJ72W_23925 [Actinoallomurus sp.]